MSLLANRQCLKTNVFPWLDFSGASIQFLGSWTTHLVLAKTKLIQMTNFKERNIMKFRDPDNLNSNLGFPKI